MAWRLANSLVVLRTQVRNLHPGTTVWDIGDGDHHATASDHNPNAASVVCAIDVLGDAGLDLGWFAAAVVASGHPALKYVIYDQRIWSRARASEGWRPYTGRNPHASHVHVSVGIGPDGKSTGPYDDTSSWGLLEEDDVELSDTVRLTTGSGGRTSAGTAAGMDSVSVNGALAAATGAHYNILRKVLPRLVAIQAAIAGEDPVDAVRAAVREEFATLTGQLVEALADQVPAEVVEGAVRSVLGSLDEG